MARQYGMPYRGSKARIAGDIINQIPPAEQSADDRFAPVWSKSIANLNRSCAGKRRRKRLETLFINRPKAAGRRHAGQWELAL